MCSAIESDEDLPGTSIDFSRGDRIDVDGTFTGTGLLGILEGKNYRELDKIVPFVASFIDRSTKHENRAPKTRVHTHYSEIAAYVPNNIKQRA